MNCQSRTQSGDLLEVTRRHFFSQCGVGVGKIALASLLANGAARAFADADDFPGGSVAPVNPLAPKPPHYPAKAKAIIHLFMGGAPSHLDLFDYKPKLAQFEGKPIPPEIIGGQRYAFIRPDAAALGPRFKFAKHGQCGAEISEVMPHLAKVVDDICIVRSCHTDQFNHAPAQIFFNTGFSQPGRPSIGSWVTYGIGAETSRSARLHRHVDRHRPQRRRGPLVQWILAHGLYRRPARAIPAIRFSTSAARRALTPKSSDKRSTC